MARRFVSSRRMVGPPTSSRRRFTYLRRVSVVMLEAFIPLKNPSRWISCDLWESSLAGFPPPHFPPTPSHLLPPPSPAPPPPPPPPPPASRNPTQPSPRPLALP